MGKFKENIDFKLNSLIQHNTNNLTNDNNNITQNICDNLNLLPSKIYPINYKSNRKYNTSYRKKLLEKFEFIKDKKILIDIYYIIINDIGPNLSNNINGIFINMNILSDNCIDNILNYLNNLNNQTNYLSSETCKLYKLDDIEILSELGHKFSNQEKHLLKRLKKDTNL